MAATMVESFSSSSSILFSENVLLKILSEKKDDRWSYLKTALIAAERAGEIISNTISKQKTVETKSSASDLVTEVDKQVEKLIFDILRIEFGNHCFIGEESDNSIQLTNQPTWIVDPIDGTTNFIHTNNDVAVCIALVINRQVEIGLVYVPMLNELYVAAHGEGSYLNERQLEIRSPVTKINNALIATEWGSDRSPSKMDLVTKNLKTILGKHLAHGVRFSGSAAINMCRVASGAVDLYYEFGPHCWDVAAASLIVTEAGGFLATPKGGEFDMMCRSFMVASSRSLIDELVPSMECIAYERDDK